MTPTTPATTGPEGQYSTEYKNTFHSWNGYGAFKSSSQRLLEHG